MSIPIVGIFDTNMNISRIEAVVQGTPKVENGWVNRFRDCAGNPSYDREWAWLANEPPTLFFLDTSKATDRIIAKYFANSSIFFNLGTLFNKGTSYYVASTKDDYEGEGVFIFKFSNQGVLEKARTLNEEVTFAIGFAALSSGAVLMTDGQNGSYDWFNHIVNLRDDPLLPPGTRLLFDYSS